MTGPAWVAVGFAVLMLLITACSAGRLTMARLSCRGAESDADALHVFMGVAMAGLFETRLSLVPGTAWLLMFTAGAAWFAWQAIRARRQGTSGSLWRAHPAPHVVECAAMMYMFLPASRGQSTAMPGMSGSAPASNPALALVLALFMLGYTLWTADRLAAMSRARAAAVATSARPDRQPAGVRGPGASGVAVMLTLAAAPARLVTADALAPRFAACYKIAMSVGMGYMLIAML